MTDKEHKNVLVEIVDTGLMIGEGIGHAVGSTVKELREGKVTPTEVLTDLAHGEVKIFIVTSQIAQEAARVMRGEVKTLVDQRGNHPDIGLVIRSVGGVMRFLTGAVDGLGILTGWTGSALESAFSALGVKPEEKKE